MKKVNRQKQHHQPPENASRNLSLKTRGRKNLRRMKVKTRKRKMTVMQRVVQRLTVQSPTERIHFNCR